jgi:ketosteroid isomerase-like protein
MTDSVAARFYGAFAARDWRGMGALYADDAKFSDPVFVSLNAREVRAMWQMLVTRGADLRIEHQVLNQSAGAAQVRWTAHYTFSQTGRPVTNIITAAMRFRDGRIVDHRDVFDFHQWSRQALGMPGLLLGWTPFFQRAVQNKARAGLRQFMQRLEGGRPA